MAQLTIAEYKTKLTTHATTAGAAWFLFGWFDEINPAIRDKTTKSPFIAVEPTQWKLNNRTESGFDITFKCNGYVDYATSREASLDSLVTVLNSFIDAINTDDNLSIAEPDVGSTLIDFGSIVENFYVISFETTIKIIC